MKTLLRAANLLLFLREVTVGGVFVEVEREEDQGGTESEVDAQGEVMDKHADGGRQNSAHRQGET